MERIKPKITVNKEQSLQTLASALVSRANMAASLGQQTYGGNRDIYQALGYPITITYEDYAARYLRQDMAKAVIDRPAKATWQGELNLQESKVKEDSALETKWKLLNKQLKLKSKFSRVDRLSAIGSYGVLLLGLDDVTKREHWSNPVTVGTRKLLYVKPFGEGSAKISSFETNPGNPRFGLPLIYQVSLSEPISGTTTGITSTMSSETVNVHYSRVIHIIDDILENEVVGTPRLEAVFNRLIDLEKIVGGDAEMFWRGARPGFQGKVDKDFQLTTSAKADLQAQIDEYEHNLRRMLVNEGVTYEALQQAISDPTNHVDIQIQMISAVTGIPKRILTGTERGELSSGQDATEYRTYVQNRREDHAETHIVRPFVDRCIEIGVLPKPKVEEEYNVVWSDIFAISEKELVDVGRARSEALRNYTTSPMAEAVIPPEAFKEFFLGLNPDQIALMENMDASTEIRESMSLFEQQNNPSAAVLTRKAKQPIKKSS